MSKAKTRFNRKQTNNNSRYQRGSSTVFFGFFMPVMLMMIVLVADIGQLIFERIRLQEVVDASTLAAANIQSIGMNEIADLNRDALLEYNKFVRIMGGIIWNDSGQANRAARYYGRVFNSIHGYQEEANKYFARLAQRYAQNYVQRNLPGAELTPVQGSSLNALVSYQKERLPVNWLYYTAGCKYCYNVTKIWTYPDSPRFIGHHDGRKYIVNDRTLPVPGFKLQEVRWIKDTPPVTYAAYSLKQRPKGFLLGRRIFDAIIPEMVAYSSAKPTRGHIFNMDARYRPILKHLQRHSPNPAVPSLRNMEH